LTTQDVARAVLQPDLDRSPPELPPAARNAHVFPRSSLATLPTPRLAPLGPNLDDQAIRRQRNGIDEKITDAEKLVEYGGDAHEDSVVGLVVDTHS